VFQLGWFGNLTAPEWSSTPTSPYVTDDPTTWMDGRFYIDQARNLERAGFDFLMLEDSLMVPDMYKGNSEMALKHARYAPKLDPVVVASMLAYATEHIGIICTASTTFYNPFHLARQFATLDHVTRGRIGWNIVTSSEDRAAQNYGMDKLPEHDLRYAMASEFVEAAKSLWSGWDEDAIVADPDTHYYADFTKVHRSDFEGEFYKTRGPLNVPRSPQVNPVFCQAGGSPAGRDFAAKNADLLLNIPNGPEAMKEFRDDIRRRAEGFGRDPDEIKIFFVIYPIVGESDERAQAIDKEWYAREDYNFEVSMSHFEATQEIDMSVFDPDQPLPDDVSTNGHQSTLENTKRGWKGKTVRQGATSGRTEALPLVGSPSTIADRMEEVMDYVGGDGFLVYNQPMSRHYIASITDGLAPELRRRGLIRSGFHHQLLRDNLRDPR
jgi:FMN-dependent oxidoreductase (nitrilotriacetate monooxygenase family)